MSSTNIEEPKKNEYGCTLFIDTFDDHPQIISDLSGVRASEMVIKGSNWLSPMTKKIIEGKFNKNNLWIYKIEKEYSDVGLYLNSPLEKMLEILDSQKSTFNGILKKYPQNHILCSAYFYETNSYFKLDKNLVRKLNHYKIDIEFDIYCLL